MIPANQMRNPETPTGIDQPRNHFKDITEHVVVLMPFGRDYGVSSSAWVEIQAHPQHKVLCKDKTGRTLAVVSAAAFTAIDPGPTQWVRGRLLHMIPKVAVDAIPSEQA